MIILSVAPLYVFISLLAKVENSRQASISERMVAGDGVDIFNATMDSSMRHDNIFESISIPLGTVIQGGFIVGPLVIDGQKFSVIFDTGSSDIVVCGPNAVNCDNRQKYNPQINKPTGPAVTLNYGSGNALGTPYVGSISVNGGLDYNQAPFIAASSVPPIFKRKGTDGIFGMSLGPLSQTKNNPFYYTLFQNYKGLGPLFAFTFSAAGGTLTIGSDKAGQDVSKINKLTVIGNNYWKVGLSSVTKANSAVNFASVPYIIFDTGGEIISAPKAVVDSLFKSIMGAEVYNENPLYYTVVCFSMPDLMFTFSDDPTPFVVKGRSLERPIPNNVADCLIPIKSSDIAAAANAWILGQPFLSTVYSRFTVGTASAPGNFVGLVRV